MSFFLSMIESLRARLPREPWRRNQLAVTVAAGMVFLGFTLVAPFFPIFVESLGVRGIKAVALWSGILLTTSPLLAAIMGPFWGRMAERFGMKLMVTRILITIAVHWGLMYFVTSVWQLLALRILLGLLSGFGTMSVALVTHGCPRERIGRSVGTLQATQILSTAVGPFLGGLLAQFIGIRNTFVVTFALCVGALLFVTMMYREGTSDPSGLPRNGMVVPQEGPVSAGVRAVYARGSSEATGGRLSFRAILALPMFIPLLPVLFFLNAVERSFSLSVPLSIAAMMPEGGAVEAMIGLVMSAGAFASAVSAYLLGRRAGRFGPMRLLHWSLVGGLLTIVPMAFCSSILPFACLRILLGFAVGGAVTLVYTIGGEIIPSAARAPAYSLLSSTAMLGGSMGPLFCSLLTSFDLRATFLAGGILYLVLILFLSALIGRIRREIGSGPAAVRAGAPAGGH